MSTSAGDSFVTDGHERLEAAEALAQVGTCELHGTRVVACSPEFMRIHGYPDDAPPQDVAALLSRLDPADRDGLADAIDEALSSGAPYRVRYRVIRPDGTRRVVSALGTVSADAAGQRVVFAAAQDVTENERAISRLVAAESRYSAIVEHANDGIWILNRKGLTTFVNRRMTQMLGHPAADILGRPPADFAEGELPDLVGERRTHFECRYRRRNGEALWTVSSRSQLPETHGGGIVLMVTDITARKQMEERLRHAAENDPMTGLMNRARFEQMLDALLEDGTPQNEPLALLFLDLDHFKYVNDSFGHAVGDALIREVAECIQALVREGDVVARFASDEFLIALPGTDDDVALTVAQRFWDAIRGRRWQTLSRITASIGVVVVDRTRTTSRSELLIAADAALRDAKSNGRDQVAVYSGQGGGGGFRWVDEIRAALDEERFVMHGQAIVPTREAGAARYELLLRMIGRDGALIPPGSFIPAAEQFGIMPEVDRWVVARALELAQRGIAVEVNLSGASLGDHDIRCTVEAAIAAGTDPRLLTFEVTETAAAQNIEDARSFAEQLERLGCAFALDDFGTGFGSLIYLKNLPVSQLKIDIEFVRDCARNPGDERLVRAIVEMARPLGLETVAEGVEDQVTLELLREIGVDFVQGFGVHTPMLLDMAANSNPLADLAAVSGRGRARRGSPSTSKR
jgi:diguanylate cyclase (GGDEF)-like protein/PAS domain S-box-containing protein